MSTPSFTDGKLHEKEISCWPGLDFSFKDNPTAPDLYTRVFTRTFRLDPLRYAPKPSPKRVYYQRLTYSNVLSNAAWTKTGLTVNSATERNPWDGELNVDDITEDTANSAHSINRAFTYATGFLGTRQRYWLSAIVAIDPVSVPRYLLLRATDASGDYYQAFFNPWTGAMINTLATGAGAANTIARVIKLPRGPNPSIAGTAKQFYWIALRFTPSAGAGSLGLYLTQDTSTTSYTGTGVGPVYVAQIQLGGGSILTSELGPLILSGATAPLTVSAPEIDAIDDARAAALGADPFAFHVAETPIRYESRRRALVTRTYARIPRQQIVPDSRFFTRPSVHAIKSGTAYGVSFIPGMDHIFTSARKSISSIGGITLGTTPVDAAAEVVGTLPHDTFYMEDSAGSNLTQFCDASIASISAALITTFSTGLSNWTIVGTPGGFTIKWTNGARNIKLVSSSSTTIELTDNVQSGSFTIRALKPAVTSNDTQKPNLDPSVRQINATAHGGAVGNYVAFWNEDSLVATSIVYGVPGSGAFTVPLKDVDGKDLTLTHCAFSPDADLCVLNGPKTCSIQRITDFYLPGYTAGITTAADIPAQDPATDSINWLAAIIAGSTWVNIDGSELKPWQGPILQREYAQVQLADAVQTVTP